MKKILVTVVMVAILAAVGSAHAALSVTTGELTGTTDWLADVRLRNFQTAVSGDYHMMVNASPIRTVGENQANGYLPYYSYNQAAWAQHNDFWITYNPGATSSVSLRLLGSGQQAGGATGGYDVTISHAPDVVTAGPVNYINVQLWDRISFPTFTNGLTLSSLNGTNLGNFSLAATGIGNWSILDQYGSSLNKGFVLQGSFDLDLTKLDGGKEGDKIVFAIGNNALADVTPTPIPAAAWLLGSGLLGLVGIRRRNG